MAFTETLHPRGTGAVGGQFVAGGAAAKKTTPPAQKNAKKNGAGGNLSFDGKRGAGYGTKGGDKRVKSLQEALNRLGLTDGSGKKLAVDGKLGPRTTAAIKKAQRKLGLKADGVVTPKLLAQLTKAKKLEKPKKTVAKKVTPRKVAPPRPNRSGKGGEKAAPFVADASRTIVERMDASRHGTHNQKSHGNRLGKPSNVAGKTGLSKATASLADKPELGPQVAPKIRKLSAADVRDILNPENRPHGGSKKVSEHRRLLEEAGAGPDQAREILKGLGVKDPDSDWESKDVSYGTFFDAEREAQEKAAADQREKLAMATPAAFARLLGTDGQPALVKSKPVVKVFESMQANGWKMTAASGHGGYTFSSPDGGRKIQVLSINGVKIYDERHNQISGVKALALVEGSG